MELVAVSGKINVTKEYVLRGPVGEVRLKIAREGTKRQLNLKGVDWGEGWKLRWNTDEKFMELVGRCTGAKCEDTRIIFFDKIYQMELFPEPEITQEGENETFTFKGPTDTTVVTKRRREQHGLRKHLLENGKLKACAICGTSLPPEFLVVAHIKKRSEAEEADRKDKNIVLPMCKFGCDALFEDGWIGVEDGDVVSIREDGTSDLNNKINPLLGRQVTEWHGPAQVYFRWHMTFHRGNMEG